MKFLTAFFILVSSVCYGQDGLILELQEKPQLGRTIKVKIKRKKVKKKGLKYKLIKARNVEVHSSIGSYHKGSLSLPNEADNIVNHQLELRYRSLLKPTDWYDTAFSIDYSGTILADFSGENGTNGESGTSRWGLFLIGRNGNDGGNGSNGKAGENGQRIQLTVSAAYDSIVSDTLVKAVVKSGLFDRNATYLFNPRLGKLIVSANGGKGGNGGDGGGGGNGKNAKPATEKKSSKSAGCGGDGGDGGDAGRGGNGGSIKFLVNPSAKRYMHLISSTNVGGKGGSAGTLGSAGTGGRGCPGESSGRDGFIGTSGNRGSKGADGAKPTIIYLDEERLKSKDRVEDEPPAQGSSPIEYEI